MRIVALLGIVMAGVGVALIARHYRRSPALAVALGVANPLVLLHLLGGSHNDSLMLGFLALGFAAFLRDRGPRRAAGGPGHQRQADRGPGADLHGVELARRPVAEFLRRSRLAAGLLVVVAAVVAVLCLAVGVGAGWISRSRAPDSR